MDDWEVDVLLSVRPSSSVEVVNALVRKIKALECKIHQLKEEDNE